MSGLIVPHFAVGSGDEITLDGVVYKVPRVDSAGRLYTNAYAVGASEVKAVRAATVTNSTTRATAITPASGKKVRIISCAMMNISSTVARFEAYFGTGVNNAATPSKNIMDALLDADFWPNQSMVWPDGGGPVGAANDVVSIRTTADIAGLGVFDFVWREE